MWTTYGSVQGSRGAVTRTGGQLITAKVNTWTRMITTWLDKDNGAAIEISDYRKGNTLARFDGSTDELVECFKAER